MSVLVHAQKMRLILVWVVVTCAYMKNTEAQPADCSSTDQCYDENNKNKKLYCGPNYTCLECKQCDKDFNRQPKSIPNDCVKYASHCGPCLKGMVENLTLNSDRCVLPPPKDEGNTVWWYLAIVVLLAVGIVVAICYFARTCIYRSYNKLRRGSDIFNNNQPPGRVLPSAPLLNLQSPPPPYEMKNVQNQPFGPEELTSDYIYPQYTLPQDEMRQKAKGYHPPAYVRVPPEPPREAAAEPNEASSEVVTEAAAEEILTPAAQESADPQAQAGALAASGANALVPVSRPLFKRQTSDMDSCNGDSRSSENERARPANYDPNVSNNTCIQVNMIFDNPQTLNIRRI